MVLVEMEIVQHLVLGGATRTGGIGVQSSIDGTATYRAGGGGSSGNGNWW